MPSRRQLANAIRALSMDAVQKANSGHPGMPMGMADIAQVLWGDHLRHDPAHPHWPDRDRFVLSNGHGSMLQYALLHLAGYDLPLQELKNFRQLHSKTAGHPERHETPGVETTTGPLGQGIGNAVGYALSGKRAAALELERLGKQPEWAPKAGPRNPAAIERALQDGHEIASHTEHHTTSETTPYGTWRDELDGLTRFVREEVRLPPEALRGFRAPFVQTNPALFDALFDAAPAVAPVLETCPA